MTRPRSIVLAAVAVGVLAAPVPAIAASTGTTGQPNQSCEDQPSAPPGFASGGFANAESNYAGSGSGSVEHAGSTHAVSQYDVACFQVSSR